MVPKLGCPNETFDRTSSTAVWVSCSPSNEPASCSVSQYVRFLPAFGGLTSLFQDILSTTVSRFVPTCVGLNIQALRSCFIMCACVSLTDYWMMEIADATRTKSGQPRPCNWKVVTSCSVWKVLSLRRENKGLSIWRHDILVSSAQSRSALAFLISTMGDSLT